MRKLFLPLILAGFILFPCLSFADSITLNSAESITPITWDRISDWTILEINPTTKTLVIKYRRRNGTDIVIDSSSDRHGYKRWYCRDLQQGDNAACLDVDDPWDCCTGLGTGTCPEDIDTCFSDVFGFTIRTQDVGTGIGIGLRTLIWSQMKQDILTGINDGTFD